MINSPVARTNSRPYGITVEKASGSTLFTKEFGEMDDFCCGIGVNNLGHRNAEIEEAVRNQAVKYLHTMVYGELEMDPVTRYATEVTDVFSRPNMRNGVGDLGDVKVWFTTSGTEATELAMKLATLYTGRTEFVAVEGGFHGRTTGALALTYRKEYREPFKNWVNPNICKWIVDGSELGLEIKNPKAALFMELIRGEDGVKTVDASMAERVQEWCKDTETLLVIDEVQTGLTRTGSLFALDQYPTIHPDIVVLGKALGGGLPLGAVVARSEIFDTIEKEHPFTHLSTFGGNPVSCAAGREMLKQCKNLTFERQGISEEAEVKRHTEIFEPLNELPVSVRGRGYMYGIDLQGLNPDRVLQGIWRNHVFVGRVLHDHSTIRFYPPVNMSSSQIRNGVIRIADVIKKEISLG